MTNIIPSMPYEAIELCRQFVYEDNAYNYHDLTKKQINALFSVIARDKSCFEYTNEFGLLRDMIADHFEGEFKCPLEKTIRQTFSEAWIDLIENTLRVHYYDKIDEDAENEYLGHGQRSDSPELHCYSDKHGV